MSNLINSDSNIDNPYIVGRPVKNSEMFFGRNDVFGSVLEKLKGQYRDNGVVIYGQSRIGKTSILNQMSSQLSDRYLCILVDLHAFKLSDLNSFLWELADHMTGILHDYQINLPTPNYDMFMKNAQRSFENIFLRQVWSAIGDKHILLMLDEASRLQEQNMKFDLHYLRPLMQNYEKLNFLFSFGNRLEEVNKEYAFVFNPLLCIKISFLDQSETNNLVTQPVNTYYHFDPAALERIFQITSGHPYHTQLLCHCLFNRWQKRGGLRGEHIEVQDVEEVLNEAIGLGLMTFKQVWLESKMSEKAVMTGMVAAMEGDNRLVRVDAINDSWRTRCEVKIAADEMMKAIRRLLERDIIAGEDEYIFTVDLLRMWIQKNKSPETAKDEIDEQERYNDEQEKRNWLSDIATIEVNKGMLDLLFVKTHKLASGKFMNLLKPINVPVNTEANSKPSTIFIADRSVASVQLSAVATSESAAPNVSLPISQADGLIRPLTPFPSRRRVIISGVALGLAIVGGIALVEHAYISIPRYQPHITSSQFRSLAPGATLHIYTDHTEEVYTVAWSPNGKYIASGSLDKTIKVWKASPVPSETAFITYSNHSSTINALAWSPDSKRIAFGSDDRAIGIWDVTSGRKIRTFIGHTGAVNAVSWSPDNTSIASGSADTTIRIWDTTTTGDTFKVYRGHHDVVYAVAWSPDDRRIASGAADKTVEVWDPTSRITFLAYQGHPTSVYAVAWSPNSLYIVTGGGDKAVKVWDATSGRKILTCNGHNGPVYAVAWSPDGRYIASGSADKTVKVWNSTSGNVVLTYSRHTHAVTDVAWSPDSKLIASVSIDKTVQVWKASK